MELERFGMEWELVTGARERNVLTKAEADYLQKDWIWHNLKNIMQKP